jgi:hypothetical protein
MYKLRYLDNFIIFTVVFCSLIYIVVSVEVNGYLPTPFFYDKLDTLMDFFNVQYWVYDKGRYTEWKSIYTPFSFWLVSFFPYSDNGYEPLILRQEGIFYLIGLYVIATVLILYFQLKTIMYSNKILLIMLLTMPFLFTLERGNLLFITLLFLLISSLNYKKLWIFSIFMAMAISLKIYLIALLFIPLLNLHFSRIILTLLLALFINLISANILGESNWWLFISNILEFSSDPRHYEWSYFTYSYQNILLAFTELNPKYKDIGAWSHILTLLTTFIFFLFVSIKYLLSSSSFRNEKRNTLFLLLIMLIMIVVKNSGGYVFILLFPFLSSIIFNRVSLYILLLLLLPIEIPFMTLDTITHESFISGQQVEVSRDVTSGMILRPLLFLILYYMISINFLRKKEIHA